MTLLGLDEDLKPVGYLPYINLQWTRRYYEIGEFSAQICARDYDPAIAYLHAPERNETVIVQKVQTSTNQKGRFVQLGGLFLTGLLKNDIMFPRYVYTDTPQGIAIDCVQTYCQIAGLTTETKITGGTPMPVDYLAGEELSDLAQMLKTYEMAHELRFDFMTGKIVYRVWQALDRTQSQSVNAFAVFSPTMGNVQSLEINDDASDEKNYGIIINPTTGNLYVDLRKDATQPQKQVFFYYWDREPEEGQTVDDFKNAMIQEATEELEKRKRVLDVDVKTAQNTLLYRQDYDLGDKCDIVDAELGKSYEARIVEAREVFKAGKHEVSLIFGDKTPTIFERMMLR